MDDETRQRWLLLRLLGVWLEERSVSTIYHFHLGTSDASAPLRD